MTVEQAVVELLDVEVDDLAHLRLGQLPEDDDVIQAVQELRAELLLEFRGHLVLHALVARLGVRAQVEAGVRGLGDVSRTQIGGQDDDGVLEVHLASLSIRQMTVVKHLQQRVENVGMGLFDLIEQHHGERLAAHLLGELAALLVTDVSRRSAEQARRRVLLGEFRHVHADQGVLVVEQELREGLGQLGLADAGRASEDERTGRTLRILESHTSSTDGAAQRGHGLVLSDDALVEFGFHAHQLLGLRLRELEHRNARGLRNHLGDDVLVHDHLHVGFAFAPRGFLLLALGLQLLLLVAQLGGLLEVLVLDGLVLLFGQLGDLRVELLELRRGGQATDAQTRAGLIDQIDGLVGQMTVLDIPARQFGRRLQGAIGNRHVVVVLIAGTQALKDLDGLRDARLVHLNRLETTFQRRVLFDVLAVFVGGGGADGLQLTACQHRLEHIGSPEGAIGGARAHDGVNLIDEQHDVAAGLDFLEHLLETLLEITAVAGTGDHGSQIQRIHLLVLQCFRNIARIDLLGQPLHHGGLADAGLADQHRIVLGATAQHDHDAFDLLRTSDHRIELAFRGFGGQIAPELVEDGGTGLVASVLDAAGIGEIGFAVGLAITGVAPNQVDGRAAQLAEIDVHLDQHLRADALALVNQAEQNVLGADIAVPQLQRLTQRQLQHLPGMRSEGNVAVWRCVPLADHLHDLLAGVLQSHALRGQCLGRDALALANQAKQQMLGTDVVVLEGTSFFLRQHDHAPRTVCKPFEHACPSTLDNPTTLYRFAMTFIPPARKLRSQRNSTDMLDIGQRPRRSSK